MATERKRFACGLAAAGVITVVVALIRTTVLSTDAWLIIILWAGGAIMVILGIVIARLKLADGLPPPV